MLTKLFGLTERYEKQLRGYLETARLSALEHEVAAEHHAALGRMYRERAERLELELDQHLSHEHGRVERRIAAVK